MEEIYRQDVPCGRAEAHPYPDQTSRGHTTRGIAESIHVGMATVDTYRARIKEKMRFRNGTELQHFAIRWVRERE